METFKKYLMASLGIICAIAITIIVLIFFFGSGWFISDYFKTL